MAEGEDRTEAPSARRLDQARADGNVAISREMTILGSLGLGLLMLAATLPQAATGMMTQMRAFLENLGQPGQDNPALFRLVGETMRLCAGIVAPVVVAALVGGTAMALLQSGLLLRPAALMPDFGRLNPQRGLGRLVGGETLAEALKSGLKLAAFSVVIWHMLGKAWQTLAGTVALPPEADMALCGRLLKQAVIMLLGVQVVIAGLDMAWTRYRRNSKLRMSREEIKDEFKETEGDPHIKGRIRQMRHQRARRRMMAAVPKAAVVITNPTHYAVALSYEQGSRAAPRLVAKGVDEVAARIREVAHASGVPVVPNPPLARALHKLEIETEIQREHFQAVAAVIAYVWRQKRPTVSGPPVR